MFSPNTLSRFEHELHTGVIDENAYNMSTALEEGRGAPSLHDVNPGLTPKSSGGGGGGGNTGPTPVPTPGPTPGQVSQQVVDGISKIPTPKTGSRTTVAPIQAGIGVGQVLFSFLKSLILEKKIIS